MGLFPVSDRYYFDIDKLIDELKVLKLEKMSKMQKKNANKTVLIREFNDTHYVTPSELDKILKHIKEINSITSLQSFVKDGDLVEQ